MKAAHESKDLEAIDKALEAMNTVWQAASQEMYAQDGAEGAQPGPDAGADAGAEGSAEDVEFEEVTEDEEKK